jgi:Dolichyl-phosphate-mannose-protein mannosyltransferase
MLWNLRSPELRSWATCLTLLVGFSAALRLYGLDRWSLWLDETGQYSSASKPLNELYTAMHPQEMPISFLLGHVLIRLGFDRDVWQLRLSAAIFGVATVIMVLLLARELFDRRVAWFSGLVACVMPTLVIYSQEYRFYSLLTFLTVLSGWSLVVAMRTNRPGWWFLFVGATILSLYTHFVAIVSTAGLGLFALFYVLLKLRQHEPIKPILFSSILAFGIVAIAYFPAIPMFARFLDAEGKIVVDPPGLHWQVFKLIFVDHTGFGRGDSLIASLAILGITWSSYRSPRALLFLVATLGVPALCFVFHGYARISGSSRYTLLLMPSYAVAIGAGLAAMTFACEVIRSRLWPGSEQTSPVASVALTVLFILAAIRPLSNVYAANPKQLPVDLREGFDYVRSRVQPNDLLLEASTTQGGSVYWFHAYDSYFLRRDVWPRPSVKGLIDDQNFPNALASYTKMHGRLWVIVTVGDAEQPSMQGRGGAQFDVRCFRRICAIRSLMSERPMLDQLRAFFDRFADVDPKYFEASARAVRSSVDPSSDPR